MRPLIRRFLLPLLFLFCGALPLARAQDIAPKDLHPGFGGNGLPAPQLAPADVSSSDKVERPPPTLAFFAAVISLVVVMCVICAPSRKAESANRK